MKNRLIIGVHDAEKEHFKNFRNKDFPNYALMKKSAWHKAKGDKVEEKRLSYRVML